MSHIHAPTFKDIWFIRLPIALFYALLALPAYVKAALAKKEPEILEESDEEDEEPAARQKRTPRQREPVKAAEVVNGGAPVVGGVAQGPAKAGSRKEQKTGPWTDNEVATLIRLLKKFPIGSSDRWEKIAEAMNRSSQDILDKVKALRTAPTANVIPEQQNSNKSLWVESEISTKDGSGDENEDDDDGDDGGDPAAWTQAQQKQLEMAMVAFPKWTEGRWDLIADRIDGKSKKACMARVKFLIESVKSKKQQQQQ